MGPQLRVLDAVVRVAATLKDVKQSTKKIMLRGFVDTTF